MATSTGNDTKDILICPICLEKLNKPKYLPCLHTFCEGCVQTYITSGFEKGNTENINCPICRYIVLVPHNHCSAENWAKQLPINCLIVGLLEKEKVQREDKRCMPCERTGVQSDACALCVTCSDILCETCERCHRSNKFTSDHDIRPLSEIPDGKLLPKAFVNKCDEHKTKKLKLFCADHDVPCCSMCVSINHRKCEQVITIEDAAHGYLSDKNIDKIEQALINFEEDMKTIISHNKHSIAELDNQYKAKEEKIESVSKDLISAVEEFKTKKKSELQKLYDQKKDDLETHSVIIENNLKAISNEREILKVSKNEASDVQVMLEAMKISKLAEDHKKLLKVKAKECNFSYELTLDNVDLGKLNSHDSDLDNLCKVDVKEERYALKLVTDNVVTETVYKFNRFNDLNSGLWSVNNSTIDAIYFIVSGEISLLGILSYACNKSKISTARITLTLGKSVLAETTCTLDEKNANDNLIEVKFIHPVRLKPNTRYRIIIRTTGYLTYCNYGSSEQLTVECEGILFKFENDPESWDRTSVYVGQIPGFIFSC